MRAWLYYIMIYYTVLYHTCTIPYYKQYTIYNTILYIVLYYTILYSTLLYYTILYIIWYTTAFHDAGLRLGRYIYIYIYICINTNFELLSLNSRLWNLEYEHLVCEMAVSLRYIIWYSSSVVYIYCSNLAVRL